jgi:hypothetical protein
MPLHVGHTKIPGSATFPDGLPAALGTSVALQASSEAVSSDSDIGGMQLLLGDPSFSLAMLIEPQDVSARWGAPATVALHEGVPQEVGGDIARVLGPSHQPTSHPPLTPPEPPCISWLVLQSFGPCFPGSLGTTFRWGSLMGTMPAIIHMKICFTVRMVGPTISPIMTMSRDMINSATDRLQTSQ